MKSHVTTEERQAIKDVIIASVSGGKDSTAMCLHLKELGLPYKAVHLATGWESAETDVYLNDYLPTVIGPITILRAEVNLNADQLELAQKYETRLGVKYSAMVRFIIKKGMFPTRVMRWCTRELKIIPIKKFLTEMDDEPINAIGIRGAESARRAAQDEWEWNKTYDCDVWRPIHSWSLQDVINIHHRHGIAPNPLYLSGSERVGCWPCVFARKDEIVRMADQSPERIDLIEALEAEVLILANARYASRGETPESLGYGKPGWFMNPSRSKRTVTRDLPVEAPDMFGNVPPTTITKEVVDGNPWPIRDVVAYARSKKKTDQVELFAGNARDAGCMRWGLCDTGSRAVSWEE